MATSHGKPACINVSTHVPTQDDNIHAAIPMRSAAKHSRSAKNYAHEQPHVAEHQGRTDYASKRAHPQPPHTQTRGTFHRRLQPLHTEKRNVSCSGFLPKTHPVQHECSPYNTFRSITCLTRMSQQTWQQNMTAIMQPTSQASTSLRHHFPITSVHHHFQFPRSPLPYEGDTPCVKKYVLEHNPLDFTQLFELSFSLGPKTCVR